MSRPSPAADTYRGGGAAARQARASIEEALLLFTAIPVVFDREGLRDRLLRAIECTYAAQENGVTSTVHLDGLREAAAIVSEVRALLGRAQEPGAVSPLSDALLQLGAAEQSLSTAADAVVEIQLARRAELTGGLTEVPLPPPRPLRASSGEPELHAISRRPLLPWIDVGENPARSAPAGTGRAEGSAPARHAPGSIARPRTFEELRSFAMAAASGAFAEGLDAATTVAAAAPEPPALPPFAFEPAVEEVEVLRRLGRDCLEDIANSRNLRKPNAIESWLDQEPFEQRILDNLDAFAAVGTTALPQVSLFLAEARSPDPERAFAAALTLGCTEGCDSVGAALMALKQSPPETFPGWLEGLFLAPNPAVDDAMADLCNSRRPEHVALALDVLHARGRMPDEVAAALLHRPEPVIAMRVARALAAALPRRDAIAHLERLCASTEDDDVFLAAVEALLRRGHRDAIALLRHTIDTPASAARGRRALPLLCLVGRSTDLDRLLAAANTAPAAHLLRSLGRFGHVESLGVLLKSLEHEDAEVVASAAEALVRITGAGLRETVEEPWDIELPPEAADAGGVPIPTRKVERLVTDPERWSAWLRDKAPCLDAKLKTRGGVPFTPLQIVDELEARITPPAAREEAALELALVTGLRLQFSPHDWVARQRRHLSELRARVAALKVAPGAWSHGLVRESEQPVVRLPSPLLGAASAPELPSCTPNVLQERWGPLANMPDAPPPRGGAGTALPARPHFPEPGLPGGTGRADLAAGHGAPRSPLPPPEAAWTGRHEAHGVREQSVDATMAMPAFVPNAALPFRPVDPGHEGRPDARIPEQVATTRNPVDVAETAAAPLAYQHAALPFRVMGATQGDTAPELERRSSASVSDTSSTPLSPTAPPLPLSPSSSAPPPPPAKPDTSGAESVLSLAQYASLCAELAVFPWVAEAIFRRYGLEILEKRFAVDAAWKERLQRDRGQYEAWQQMYRSYHDDWTKRGTPAD